MFIGTQPDLQFKGTKSKHSGIQTQAQ